MSHGRRRNGGQLIKVASQMARRAIPAILGIRAALSNEQPPTRGPPVTWLTGVVVQQRLSDDADEPGKMVRRILQSSRSGTRNLLLCQEWPSLEGERFMWIMIPMVEALQFAAAILAVVREPCRSDQA